MEEYKGLQYRGYGRFLCAIASGADAEAFLPILLECKKRRFHVYCNPEARRERMLDMLDAASAVIVFVSARFAEDDALRDFAAYASCHGKPLISVYLEDVPLENGLAMLLNSRQALFISGSPDMGAFYEKLFSAKTMQNMRVAKIQTLRRFRLAGGVIRTVCLIALLLALAVGLLLTGLLRPFEKARISEADVSAPQETPAVSEGSAATPEGTPFVPGSPLTIEEMDGIQGVWIIGDRFVEAGGSFDDPLESTKIPKGSIGDLSDLAQFPNLTSVRLYRQSKPVDLTPLFGCKSLRRIYLNDVQIRSFEGLEQMEQLSTLSIVDCGEIDLAPLAHCDFSFAEKEAGGFRLSITETALRDFSPLGDVRHYKLLSTDLAVSKLAPALASCKEIDELVCTNVNSMSAFGRLDCVRSLTVQDDRVTTLTGMEGLTNLETLSISGNLQHIGEVGEMPNVTTILSGASITDNRRVNPITSIDGLQEAFPNLRKASFPKLTAAENQKLAAFLAGNQ